MLFEKNGPERNPRIAMTYDGMRYKRVRTHGARANLRHGLSPHARKERTVGFISSFKRGLSGDDSYEAAGRQVECAHCGSVDFEQSTAQLNTAGLTFLGLDWANRNATILVCKECGHIEWFLSDL